MPDTDTPAATVAPAPDPASVRRTAVATLAAFADPEPVPVSGVLRLDGDRTAYLVEDGEVDVLAADRLPRGAGPGRRLHLARVGAGAVLVGSTALAGRLLVAQPLPGAVLRRLGPERLRLVENGVRTELRRGRGDLGTGFRAAKAFTRGMDQVLVALADGLREGRAPRGAEPMSADQIVSLTAGSALLATGHPVWVRAVGGCVERNGGGEPETAGGQELLTLAGRDWLVAAADCTVECRSTWDLLVTGQLWSALDEHVGRLLRLAARRAERVDADALARVAARKAHDTAVLRSTGRAFVGVVDDRARRPVDTPDTHRTGLVTEALTVVAEALGVALRDVGAAPVPGVDAAAVTATATALGLRTRSVRLPARWWREDLGALVAHRVIAGEPPATAAPATAAPATAAPDAVPPSTLPVPLVFRRGRYVEIDPQSRQHRPLRRADAASFALTALVVHPPLADGIGLRGLLLTHGLRGSGRDLRALLAAATVVALLGLATPLVTGSVFGALAQRGVPGGIVQICVLFAIGAVFSALVGVMQNLAVLRVEGRWETGVQTALWDRLLRLPTRFFSERPSGGLATTLLGIGRVREAMSGLSTQVVVAMLTAVAELVLLAVVAPAVAGLAVAVALATAVATGWCGLLVVRRQRRALPAEQHLATLTHQLLDGLPKITMARAQARAFAQWAAATTEARRGLRGVRAAQAGQTTLGLVVPLVAQAVLFGALAGPLHGTVDIATFFVVAIAYTLLIASLMQVVGLAVAVAGTVPLVRELEPLLAAEPETSADRVAPGELSGDIELSGVGFGYGPTEPPVLSDIGLHVRPGEFVAIVGPSGSGKSTLLRLLLGFETPTQGAVLYDGQELAGLDAPAVRRQCGVVLQDGALFAGSLRENICGSGEYPLSRVWQAATMAGLDEEIGAMPMGMGTIVPFGGGTLSVGQRQRVLIARALIGRPRILLFDEATSALDNRTQQVVTASTRELAATRIVIAHRLSTVVDADRIVVLDGGRIVQSGSYAALVADRDGLFHRLAARQLLDGPAGGTGPQT